MVYVDKTDTNNVYFHAMNTHKSIMIAIKTKLKTNTESYSHKVQQKCKRIN